MGACVWVRVWVRVRTRVWARPRSGPDPDCCVRTAPPGPTPRDAGTWVPSNAACDVRAGNHPNAMLRETSVDQLRSATARDVTRGDPTYERAAASLAVSGRAGAAARARQSGRGRLLRVPSPPRPVRLAASSFVSSSLRSPIHGWCRHSHSLPLGIGTGPRTSPPHCVAIARRFVLMVWPHGSRTHRPASVLPHGMAHGTRCGWYCTGTGARSQGDPD